MREQIFEVAATLRRVGDELQASNSQLLTNDLTSVNILYVVNSYGILRLGMNPFS